MKTAPKGRILIADDEQTFVAALADLLRREGYECQPVPDGLAAAAELNTTTIPYDLLIADIRMPGNAELELIKHLRQIAEGLPVILVTAFPDTPTALLSAELPVLSYLIKPVNFPELLKLVRRGIEHSAVFRTNREIARRLAAWSSDTNMVEQFLVKGVASVEFRPAKFVNLSTRNLLGCMSEISAMWQRLESHEAASAPGAPDAPGAPVAPDAASAAISDAIANAMRVFQLTGATFQSRDDR